MNAWVPYVIAVAGIASTIYFIAWVIRDLWRDWRGGSLHSSPAPPSVDALLEEMRWDFPMGPRLP